MFSMHNLTQAYDHSQQLPTLCVHLQLIPVAPHVCMPQALHTHVTWAHPPAPARLSCWTPQAALPAAPASPPACQTHQQHWLPPVGHTLNLKVSDMKVSDMKVSDMSDIHEWYEGEWHFAGMLAAVDMKRHDIVHHCWGAAPYLRALLMLLVMIDAYADLSHIIAVLCLKSPCTRFLSPKEGIHHIIIGSIFTTIIINKNINQIPFQAGCWYNKVQVASRPAQLLMQIRLARIDQSLHMYKFKQTRSCLLCMA